MRSLLFLLLALPLFADGGACPATWGYDPAKNGPDRWGQMDPLWAECDTGTTQSPVDLGSAAPAYLPPVTINYQPRFPMTVQNTSHEIKVWPLDVNTVEYEGVTYELIQFHFHVPAEHRVASTEFASELHLVHRSDDGKFLVLGVFIVARHPNIALENLRRPAAFCTSLKMDSFSLMSELLPPRDSQASYYFYEGSLTTPACTPGIRFLIFSTPISASPEQIKALKISVQGNARPIQPLGRRIVRKTGK